MKSRAFSPDSRPQLVNTREEIAIFVTLIKEKPTIRPDLDIEEHMMTLVRAGFAVESPVIVKELAFSDTMPRSVNMCMPARKTREVGSVAVNDLFS